MRTICIVVIALLAGACASPQERETQLVGAAQSRCMAAGVQLGTPQFGVCVSYAMASIEAMQRQRAATMLGYGAAMLQPNYTTVNVAPMTCTRVIPGTMRCY